MATAPARLRRSRREIPSLWLDTFRHVAVEPARLRPFASEERPAVGFLDPEVRLQPLERFTLAVPHVLAHPGGRLVGRARDERPGEIAVAMRLGRRNRA